MRVVVSPHRFLDLEPEQAVLSDVGAELAPASDERDFARRAPDADVLLISSLTTVGRALIERLETCRAIVRYGVGVNNIDVAAATEAGIPVGNVVDASIDEVADHAVLLALACWRRLTDAQMALRAGTWSVGPLEGTRRMAGATAGILGLGRIGRAVARRLEAFGMTVVGYDPYLADAPWQLLELDDLLARADLVSVHLPLTDETRRLLTEERLRLLEPHAVVVNVSRGGILDEAALARLLAEGRLRGAGLDVFEREPLLEDDPLRDAPHLVATPHVAWYSEDAVRDLQRKAAEQAVRALRGERLDPVVNPAVYAGAAG